MATFTVTTAADVVDAGDGVLSLREALAQANATPADAVRQRRPVTIDANQASRVPMITGGDEAGQAGEQRTVPATSQAAGTARSNRMGRRPRRRGLSRNP
jgi:hypothetical protein